MRTIQGRFANLGLPQLLTLLLSSGTEGALEVETPPCSGRVTVREGRVHGELPTAALQAALAGQGVFRFVSRLVPSGGESRPIGDLLGDLQAVRARLEATVPGPAEGVDPLAELRASLREIEVPSAAPRVRVITADPRPYRRLEPEWRRRGWAVEIEGQPVWGAGAPLDLLVLHLPPADALLDRGEAWLEVARHAASAAVATPVLWIGGLADPRLRHEAVHAGVAFMHPGVVADAGEAGRWFREEIDAVACRLVAQRERAEHGGAGAFRDFFFALHADATPSEVRASLLRLAGTVYARGLLLAVREDHFGFVGGFGMGSPPKPRLRRGGGPLEEASAGHVRLRVTRLEEAVPGTGAGEEAAEVFPLMAGGVCVALFVGAAPVGGEGDLADLAGLLARSGALLGL